MTNIILPEDNQGENNDESQVEEINYNATEEDEEKFFLIYHMNIQPSEADKVLPDYRKWLIARFVAQKNMEREAMERHRLMSQIAPTLRTQ
jgi:hypothetical protein